MEYAFLTKDKQLIVSYIKLQSVPIDILKNILYKDIVISSFVCCSGKLGNYSRSIFRQTIVAAAIETLSPRG